MREHHDIERRRVAPRAATRGAIVGALLLLFALGAGPASAEGNGNGEGQVGVRFPRADLVDIAAYVSERTGKGFVLGSPELRVVPLTLYHPGDLEPEKLEMMFLELLHANGLHAEELDGYWLIVEPGPPRGRPDVGGLHLTEDQKVIMDLRAAPLGMVAGFISEVTGKQVVAANHTDHVDLTIQAHQPVSVARAQELFLTALRAEGLEVVEDGDTIIITRGRSQRPEGEEARAN